MFFKIGDASQSTHLKGRRPACWKGLVKGLKLYGYKFFLIQEYRTSKVCCNCMQMNSEGISNENFFKAKRKYGKMKGKEALVYSLLRCKVCKSIKQRDVNGTCAMNYKSMLILNGEDDKIAKVYTIPPGRLEQLAESNFRWCYT